MQQPSSGMLYNSQPVFQDHGSNRVTRFHIPVVGASKLKGRQHLGVGDFIQYRIGQSHGIRYLFSPS